jgi:hypothetical protein
MSLNALTQVLKYKSRYTEEKQYCGHYLKIQSYDTECLSVTRSILKNES